LIFFFVLAHSLLFDCLADYGDSLDALNQVNGPRKSSFLTMQTCGPPFFPCLRMSYSARPPRPSFLPTVAGPPRVGYESPTRVAAGDQAGDASRRSTRTGWAARAPPGDGDPRPPSTPYSAAYTYDTSSTFVGVDDDDESTTDRRPARSSTPKKLDPFRTETEEENPRVRACVSSIPHSVLRIHLATTTVASLSLTPPPRPVTASPSSRRGRTRARTCALHHLPASPPSRRARGRRHTAGGLVTDRDRRAAACVVTGDVVVSFDLMR
jgi:hypothetical protein